VTCFNSVAPKIGSHIEGRGGGVGDGPGPPGVLAGAASQADVGAAASLARPSSSAVLMVRARSSGTVTTR
jgi:hypothetical protein